VARGAPEHPSFADGAPFGSSRPARLFRVKAADDPAVYLLSSVWVIDATPEEVAGVFLDPASIARWWQAAFLRVDVLQPGGLHGLGATFRVHAKGRMPHTFQFLIKVVESSFPLGFRAEVMGDYHGAMGCRVESLAPARVAMECTWNVRVRKPFVRMLSTWLRPIFVANHRWAMTKGEQGLRIEVRARRQGIEIPSSRYPQPVFPHNVRWIRDRLEWKPWSASWEQASAIP